MRLWMVGQLFAMTVVGIMWGISLWARGVTSVRTAGGTTPFLPRATRWPDALIAARRRGTPTS